MLDDFYLSDPASSDRDRRSNARYRVHHERQNLRPAALALMRALQRTVRFRRDLKRCGRSVPGLSDALRPLVALLLADLPLPARYRDHALSGSWLGLRDCDVKPDLLLIYEKPEGMLRLYRLGSHSELFG